MSQCCIGRGGHLICTKAAVGCRAEVCEEPLPRPGTLRAASGPGQANTKPYATPCSAASGTASGSVSRLGVRVLAERDHLRGWHDVRPWPVAVVGSEAFIVGLPRPVSAVLAQPRLGEWPEPLTSSDPLRGPLDHHVGAGPPAVAAGGHGHQRGVLQIDVLLLTDTCAERKLPVAPDAYQRCHV